MSNLVLQILTTLTPTCSSNPPSADGRVFTSCQVLLPQASFWAQLGPLVGLAAALFAFLGGVGELVEAQDKNDGDKLRLGQRISVGSKIGAGLAVVVLVALVYYAEASVTPDSDVATTDFYMRMFHVAWLSGVFLIASLLLLLRKGRSDRRKRAVATVSDASTLARELQYPVLVATLTTALIVGGVVSASRKGVRKIFRS